MPPLCRKNQKAVEPVNMETKPNEENYSMDSYLAAAGLDPECIHTQGPPRSAVGQKTEMEGPVDSDDD